MSPERLSYSSSITVAAGEHEVSLTSSQARMLYVLQQNPGTQILLKDLHKLAWPLPGSKVSLVYVKKLISSMATKLDENNPEGTPSFIQTQNIQPDGNRNRVIPSYSLREDVDIEFPENFEEFFFKKDALKRISPDSN